MPHSETLYLNFRGKLYLKSYVAWISFRNHFIYSYPMCISSVTCLWFCRNVQVSTQCVFYNMKKKKKKSIRQKGKIVWGNLQTPSDFWGTSEQSISLRQRFQILYYIDGICTWWHLKQENKYQYFCYDIKYLVLFF